MTYDYRTADDRTWAQKWLEKWRVKRFDQLYEIASEAVEDAERVCGELDQRTDSDALDKPNKLADELVSDLRSLPDTGSLENFVTLMKAILGDEIPALETALKAAKKEAKGGRDDEPDTVALEAIENAMDFLGDVKKTCKRVEREMVKPQPSPPPEPRGDADEDEDEELPEIEEDE